MYYQQLTQVWKQVLETIDAQADCLSNEEHELVERAIILGGTAQIEDAAELEAARALSLRLWANIGLISDQTLSGAGKSDSPTRRARVCQSGA